jgi:hypothetical protein
VGPGDEAALPFLSTKTSPGRIADSLPRCPGPFGGTTVVVLPDTLSEQDVAAWREVQENDPLAAKSRFHRLRIATTTGERALPAVLATLLSEQRKNVLVVPATFYARPERMRRLEDSTSEFEDRMTIHWLPGLGGVLPAP